MKKHKYISKPWKRVENNKSPNKSKEKVKPFIQINPPLPEVDPTEAEAEYDETTEIVTERIINQTFKKRRKPKYKTKKKKSEENPIFLNR